MKKPIAVALTLAFVIACASQGRAQSPPAESAPPEAQSQPADTTTQTLKPEQLQQLVAPIALYPDSLVAEVLMASTYPLEVVEAERWLKAHNLKGNKLKAEAAKQRWDGSVKALTATPTVLEMMSGKLDWTQKLGDAVLAQQSDVMDAIQALRARAQDQKKLETTKQQKVTVRTEQNRRVIAIEPAEPDVIYVPYYEPTVYGAWPYDDYPPYWFPGLYGWPYGGLGSAIGWGIGWGIWNNWGGGFDWNNRNIHVDHHNRNWAHNPDHRRGVGYNNRDVARQFDRSADRRAANNDKRRDAARDNKRADNKRDGKRADRNQASRNKANKAGSGQRRDAKGKGNGRHQVAKGKASQRHASQNARNRQHIANAQRGNRAHAYGGRGNGRAFASGGGGGFRGGGGGGRGGGGRGGRR